MFEIFTVWKKLLLARIFWFWFVYSWGPKCYRQIRNDRLLNREKTSYSPWSYHRYVGTVVVHFQWLIYSFWSRNLGRNKSTVNFRTKCKKKATKKHIKNPLNQISFCVSSNTWENIIHKYANLSPSPLHIGSEFKIKVLYQINEVSVWGLVFFCGSKTVQNETRDLTHQRDYRFRNEIWTALFSSVFYCSQK